MARYIELDALLAEIERLRKIQPTDEFQPKEQNKIDWLAGKTFAIIFLDVFLDTIEVKEVDIDKEIGKFFGEDDWKAGAFEEEQRDMIKFAKHFFELGMAVSNPTTAADRGTVEEIIINLRRVEEDYRINLTKEIEWLRNKVKKGE